MVSELAPANKATYKIYDSLDLTNPSKCLVMMHINSSQNALNGLHNFKKFPGIIPPEPRRLTREGWGQNETSDVPTFRDLATPPDVFAVSLIILYS